MKNNAVLIYYLTYIEIIILLYIDIYKYSQIVYTLENFIILRKIYLQHFKTPINIFFLWI